MSRLFLTHIDLNKNELQNAVVQQLAAAPSSPVQGQLYYNTGDDNFYVYDGAAWVDLTVQGGAYTADAGLVLSGSSLAAEITGNATTNSVQGLAFSAAGAAGTIGIDSTIVPRLGVANTFTATQTVNAAGGLVVQNGSGAASGLAQASGSNFLLQSSQTNGNVVIDPNGTGQLDVNTSRIINVTDPTGNQDAATKLYVDNAVQGLDAKASVRVASTANGTLSGSFQNGSTVDGIGLNTGDRILLKDQTAQAENGIYTVNVSGAPTRATDLDTWTEVPNAYVWVELGTVNADTGWVSTASAGGTLNTTAMPWVQFSGAGSITAGAGLTKTGNQLDVGQNANASVTVNADDIQTNDTVVPRLAIANTFTNNNTIAGGNSLFFATGGTNIAAMNANSATTFIIQGQPVNSSIQIAPQGTGTTTFNSKRITSVADPTAAQDGATKNYVDTTFPKKFASDVGNGSLTTIDVLHNLGTKDVTVAVYDNTTPFAEVIPDVQHLSTTTTRLIFSVAPTTNQYRCVVHG